ncbi:hypothetical protein ETU09_00650 [Apibacter muscae]|uniref:Transposase n=1 Tax=Apibacter muscae TaxID=2509004 RepID=A0A563DKZ0_9FLAO|nr:hypothetical protein [Apibacter muscae]TWP30543.1 hypothetical protein ETU09_00650 [Apibacter muscae]
MYEFHNNILSIPAKVLYEDLEVVSYDTYRQWCVRGKLIKTRTARGLDSYALLDFEKLPQNIKDLIIKEYGNPPSENKSLLEKQLKSDPEAVEFFANWQLPDYRFLEESVQKEYHAHAQIFNAVHALINIRQTSRKKLNRPKQNSEELWKEISGHIQKLNKTEYPHSLPTNPTSLKRKYTRYIKEGYSSLIHANFCNQHSAKVKDTEQEASLRQLLRKHNNLDNEQISAIYNIIADKCNWKHISAATVGNYREKWDLITFAGRRGQQTFDNVKAMTVKRKAPLYPLYYWTIDGWDVELLYQKTDVTPRGKEVTTYHNRLNVVVVLDPCGKYPIGYAIGTHETPELIQQAIRNAVNHTAELFGQRHRVLQLQSDRYATKKLTPFYEAVSNNYIPAKAHNAKAKIIEPYFLRLNKKYCQLMPNWSGFGVTSRKENQPNSEILNKIRHTFPDEQLCRLQIERILEAEREAGKAKYLSAYADMPSEDKHYMSDDEYLYYLGERTGRTNKLNHEGIKVTLNGKIQHYDCFNPDFRLYGHLDWTIAYDSDNTDKILAYNEGGSLRFMLDKKYVQPMALKDRTDGDAAELGKIQQFNKYLNGKIAEQTYQDAEIVEDLFQKVPELGNTLAKLVLTDSTGNHKNNRNKARLNALNEVKKVAYKQEKQKEKENVSNWKAQQDAYLREKVDINKYL